MDTRPRPYRCRLNAMGVELPNMPYLCDEIISTAVLTLCFPEAQSFMLRKEVNGLQQTMLVARKKSCHKAHSESLSKPYTTSFDSQNLSTRSSSDSKRHSCYSRYGRAAKIGTSHCGRHSLRYNTPLATMMKTRDLIVNRRQVQHSR